MQALLTLRALPSDINEDNKDAFDADDEDDDDEGDEGQDVRTEEKQGDRRDPQNLVLVVGNYDDMPTWWYKSLRGELLTVTDQDNLDDCHNTISPGERDAARAQAIQTLRALPSDTSEDHDDVFDEYAENNHDDDEGVKKVSYMHVPCTRAVSERAQNGMLLAQSGTLVAEHTRLIAENERVHAGTQDPDIENVRLMRQLELYKEEVRLQREANKGMN